MWVITSNLYLRAALIEIIVLNYRAILVPADCPDCLVIVGTVMVTPCGRCAPCRAWWNYEHMNTSFGFNHCEMWHVGPLCTVLCCPLCTGVMMSSVSSGVLLCWWSHDLWGRHRHTRHQDLEIWGEGPLGHQQQCIPRPWYTWSYQDQFESSCLFSTVCGMLQLWIGGLQLSITTFYTSLEWTLLAIKAYYKTTQNCQ